MAKNVASLPITVGVGAFLVRQDKLLVVRKTDRRETRPREGVGARRLSSACGFRRAARVPPVPVTAKAFRGPAVVPRRGDDDPRAVARDEVPARCARARPPPRGLAGGRPDRVSDGYGVPPRGRSVPAEGG